jgi:hypothetical protein
MTTQDNQLAILTAGASDWDSDTDDNFQILERGYHITEHAGQAVSSGQVLTLNSGGFFFPYNPNSAAIAPHAYAFTAAASGDSLRALAWGIVRSLDINSPAVPGKLAFATASGFLSVATLGLPVGIFTTGEGVLFNPDHAAGGAGGVTSIQSLSDVDPTGLADGSILKWSNASSKFTMQVDSTGAGSSLAGDLLIPTASQFPLQVTANTLVLTDNTLGLGMHTAATAGSKLFAKCGSIAPQDFTLIFRVEGCINTDVAALAGAVAGTPVNSIYGTVFMQNRNQAEFAVWSGGDHMTALGNLGTASAYGRMWGRFDYTLSTGLLVGKASLDGVEWTTIQSTTINSISQIGVMCGGQAITTSVTGAIKYWKFN